MTDKAAEQVCPGEKRTAADLDKTIFLENKVSPLIFAWLSEVDAGLESVVRIAKELFSIGSDRENDLVLPASEASRIHCQIYFAAGAFEINDHNTRQGTWVNGQPARRQRLHDDDRIRIGGRDFLFKCFRECDHG